MNFPSSLVEGILRSVEPSTLTNVFLLLLALLFIFLCRWLSRGIYPTLTAHAPAILASLGILGTFVGIVVGLLDFNPNDLDGSIGGLLEGLKTAFLSSIVGIFASLAFRGIEPLLTDNSSESKPEVGPEDVLSAINAQTVLLEETRDAIAGGEESSLAGQLKLLRTDLSDKRREDNEVRKHFQAELWKRLHEFADMLSKSATEQVIEALQKVIIDFNKNLTEQFGDNFKKLDASVQKLVEWQEGYKKQLEQLHGLYSQSVKQIEAIEASVTRIAERCESIPHSMDNLSGIVETVNRQIEELERHLDAFAELRDRAIEAVPQTKEHVEKMTQEIAAAVRVAGKHLADLQDASEEQTAKSRQMVEELAQSGEQVRRDLQEVVSKASDGMTKQIAALDTAMAQEMNRVMQYMGNALGQISGKFVEDYSKLVRQMKQIVREGSPRHAIRD